jgi:uncharacterized membrane protein YhhN
MLDAKSPWFIAYATATVVHLVLLGADVTPYDSITKCVLAPLLVAWVITAGGPRILAAALFFCFLGDLFLEIEDLFTVGMAAFAVAHVLFIRYFVARGALAGIRRSPWFLLIGLVAAAGLIAACWSGLPADLKPLVPIYALLLLSTAATALAVNTTAGLGAVAFLISDSIIALGESGRVDPESTVPEVAIMVLYLSAIYLLARGIMEQENKKK